MKKIPQLIIALLFAVSVAPAFGQNLLTNGDFASSTLNTSPTSTGAVPGVGWTTYTSSNILEGETGISDGSNYFGPFTGYTNDTAWYLVNTTPSPAQSAVSIYQAVDLTAGQQYTFTAEVALPGNTGVRKDNADADVLFYSAGLSSILAKTSFTLSQTAGQATGGGAGGFGVFQDESVSFTPTTSGTYYVGVQVLDYEPGTQTSGTDPDGTTVFIDNAILIALPEPSTVALTAIFGFGMLMFFRRCRNA